MSDTTTTARTNVSFFFSQTPRQTRRHARTYGEGGGGDTLLETTSPRRQETITHTHTILLLLTRLISGGGCFFLQKLFFFLIRQTWRVFIRVKLRAGSGRCTPLSPPTATASCYTQRQTDKLLYKIVHAVNVGITTTEISARCSVGRVWLAKLSSKIHRYI